MKQTSRPSHLRPVPASMASPAAELEIPVRFNATAGQDMASRSAVAAPVR